MCQLRLLSKSAAGGVTVALVAAVAAAAVIVMSVVTAVTAQGAVATVTVVTAAAAVTWQEQQSTPANLPLICLSCATSHSRGLRQHSR